MRETSSQSLPIDDALVERLEQAHRAGAPALPRCLVMVLAHDLPAARLRATLARIPPGVRALVAEIAVLREAPDLAPVSDDDVLAELGWPNLRVLHEPRRYGFGERRKIALEYACDAGFAAVALVEGDGSTPPERLPELLAPALLEGRPVVLGARPFRRRGGARGSVGATLGRLGSSLLHNVVLGLRLRDWDGRYRVFATSILRRIPFRVNSDDRAFDTELLIQCRALGVPLHEVRVDEAGHGDRAEAERPRPLRSLATAVAYRLHQLHLVRRGQYLIFDDESWTYTLKRSPTGSHMQILEAIAPGSRVLDLGCSQGLLAAPLREKGAYVVGVDVRPGDRVSKDLDDYHERDLELPLALPEGRSFDVVVISDVLEHLRGRHQLLLAARRHLLPDGRLLVSTGNVAVWFYRLSLLLGRFEYGPRGILDDTHVHLYTRASFRREIERAGFRILRERVTALPFEVVLRSTGRSRLVRALARGYHALARAWPTLFAYQFVLEAEATAFYDAPRGGGAEQD